jgi:hypothetical protein
LRHLTFYYAIGFAVVGCLMLCLGFATFSGVGSRSYDPYTFAVLGVSMFLPFMISVLSWGDWIEIRRKYDNGGGIRDAGPRALDG